MRAKKSLKGGIMAKSSLKLIDRIFSKKEKKDYQDETAKHSYNVDNETSVESVNGSNDGVTSTGKELINGILSSERKEVHSKYQHNNRTLNCINNNVRAESHQTVQSNNDTPDNNSNDRYNQNNDEDDSIHEYDSMVLLSKIEQLAMKLSELNVKESKHEIIDILLKIINSLVEFTENRSSNRQNMVLLDSVLNHDCQNYKKLNSKSIKNNRLFIETNNISYDDDESLFQLCDDFMRIINVFLNICIKPFHSSRISEQWKTLYAGFYVNISKSINNHRHWKVGQKNEKNTYS